VKLVGLDTRRWYANDETTRTFYSSGTGLVSQKRRNLSSETIGRGTVARTFGSHAFEIGGEAALNRLDANLDLVIDGAPVAVPAGDVVVEERRAEAFIADVWTLSPKWTLEARIAGETSELTQSGDTRATASFAFAKPSIQVARKYGARNQARVRLFRDVGQLDFNDFASSAALGDDRFAAGNPDLRPDSNWRLEAGIDQRFSGKGALAVTVFREWYSDVQDVAPVNGFDTPGNIGDGRTLGVSVKSTAPLDRLVKGLTATLDGQWRRGEVTDPTTGRKREPTTFAPYQYTFELRRDDPMRKMAYGVNYRKQAEFQFYRVREVEPYEEGGNLRAYFETTRFKGGKDHSRRRQPDEPSLSTRTFFLRAGSPSRAVERRSARSATRTNLCDRGEWELLILPAPLTERGKVRGSSRPGFVPLAFGRHRRRGSRKLRPQRPGATPRRRGGEGGGAESNIGFGSHKPLNAASSR
jgi:hypothetical protein